MSARQYKLPLIRRFIIFRNPALRPHHDHAYMYPVISGKFCSYLCPMFYRRKILLALLQIFDGHLEKIRLQKLLFPFTQQQQKGEYDFIPYRFGCFSYSANADLTTMAKKGLLNETKTHFATSEKTSYLNTLKDTDKKALHEIKLRYGNMNADGLMKQPILTFPIGRSKV